MLPTLIPSCSVSFVIPGWSEGPELRCAIAHRGISRFRFRCFASPRNDGGFPMILPALFFYLFAGICVASAVMVIVSRDPVHSVLFLILAFVHAAGLFVLLGAEFRAMILVVVYVGAVAVLFLFVIMMLDVDFTELREGFSDYLPIGLLIGAIFFFELFLVVGFWVINPGVAKS